MTVESAEVSAAEYTDQPGPGDQPASLWDDSAAADQASLGVDADGIRGSRIRIRASGRDVLHRLLLRAALLGDALLGVRITGRDDIVRPHALVADAAHSVPSRRSVGASAPADPSS